MKTILLSGCLLISILSFAQDGPDCGTEYLLNSPEGKAFYDNLNSVVQTQLLMNSEKYESGSERATLVVPCVFHIVYNTAVQNINDSLIYQQIDILNNDFQRMNADTINTPPAFKPLAGSMDIQFCLAQQDPNGQPTNGILHVSTAEASFNSVTNYSIPDPVKHTASGGSDAWDTEIYLNFWSCNLVGASAYSAAPGNFADPADDGVVSHYEFFGLSGAAWPSGRTCVHEVGHFFGLKHIWGDDGGACTGTDFIADTPNCDDWTAGCPVFPVTTDPCSPGAPGIMFMNYMDYTGDDCKNMFTIGQTTYMMAVYDAIMPTYYQVDKCTSIIGIAEQEKEFVLKHMDKWMHIYSEHLMEEVEVYDMRGKLLFSTSRQGTNEIHFSFDKSGMFLFRIRFAGDELFMKRLMFLNY